MTNMHGSTATPGARRRCGTSCATVKDAKVALGSPGAAHKDTPTPNLRFAARSNSLLSWTTATAGDTFLIEAGTVHAIGAGRYSLRSAAAFRSYLSPL